MVDKLTEDESKRARVINHPAERRMATGIRLLCVWSLLLQPTGCQKITESTSPLLRKKAGSVKVSYPNKNQAALDLGAGIAMIAFRSASNSPDDTLNVLIDRAREAARQLEVDPDLVVPCEKGDLSKAMRYVFKKGHPGENISLALDARGQLIAWYQLPLGLRGLCLIYSAQFPESGDRERIMENGVNKLRALLQSLDLPADTGAEYLRDLKEGSLPFKEIDRKSIELLKDLYRVTSPPQ